MVHTRAHTHMYVYTRFIVFVLIQPSPTLIFLITYCPSVALPSPGFPSAFISYAYHLFPLPLTLRNILGGVLCIFMCTHMHVSVHPPALGIKPKALYMLNTSSTTEIHPSSLLASVFSTPRTLVSLCWPWPTLESLPWPFFQSFYNQKRRLFLWHGLPWRWDSCQT